MLGKNSDSYKAWKHDWERYKSVPTNLDLANLGSTCDANNFDYSYWNKKGFNFASGPQDMYYDNQLLEQYGRCLKKGAFVFISISEFAFLVDKYDSDYHNFKYYGYLEPQRILNYSDKKARIIRSYPGLLDNRYNKQEIKNFIKKCFGINRRKNAGSIPLDIKSKQTMSNWMHEFGWDKGAKITKKQRETISRSWDIFLKDIAYCNKNDLTPVVIIPPFNVHLKELMPNDILDECLWNYIESIKKQGIKVINFWEDPVLEDEKYYSTPICLNEDGKKLFNRRLQEEIYGKEMEFV